MFSSLSRSFHKTPISNYKSNCYENMDYNDFMHQVTKSTLATEGIYGIEQFIVDDYSEEYMFTPHICKLDQPIIEKDWSNFREELKNCTIYEITQNKQYFFPLDTKLPINLLKMMKNMQFGTVFVQVLWCKRQDNWREDAIQSYEKYTNGLDSPSTNKLLRSLQYKMVSSLSNFKVKRSPVEEIEQKILSHGYRFEMRVVLFDSKYKNAFDQQINNTLKQMTFYNELTLEETRYKKDVMTHIIDRSFQINLNNQMLSEKEMFSLLTDQSISSTQPIELDTPTKKPSITKSIEESMLLQRAIQLMPFKENQQKEIDKSKAQQVNQAMKRVGLIKESLKVNEIHQGSSLMKIQMKVPPEIMYTTIKKKLVDIQAALGNEGVSIEIGEKPDTINVYFPLENREVILFRNVLESEEFKLYKENNPLPFIIGENVNGGFMFNCLSNLRHLLVAGATGSGKSVFINLMIISFILCVPPDELNLYLIDPKQVEFSQFNGFPQVRDIITDMNDATVLLAKLCVEMDKRYEKFAKSGVKNIGSYNKSGKGKIPYCVCVIDEYADLVMVNKNVEDYIVRLSQKARAAGIHLVIATQKPLATIITSVLKSNLPSVISFRLKTSSDYMTVFGKGIPCTLLGRGDGIAMIEGQHKEFERFQSPILTLDESEEESIYNGLKKLFEDVEIIDEELPEEEQPIDKLKRIIAETNETRVSDLGRLMKIGNNAVAELIKQLVEEGFLGKEGRGYTITASEEELSKWKGDAD